MLLLNRNHDLAASVNPTTGPPPLNPESLTPVTQVSHQGRASTQLPQPLEMSRSDSIYIVPGFQLSFSEADTILEEYMAVMLPQFPFSPLPSRSSYDMYKEKPFLLKTILWVCRPPALEAATSAFEDWFRHYIAQQIVVLTNKTLELVQALLVFLAWYILKSCTS